MDSDSGSTVNVSYADAGQAAINALTEIVSNQELEPYDRISAAQTLLSTLLGD